MPFKPHNDIAERLSSLSAPEFLALGADGLAYIKPVTSHDDQMTYAIHAADGSHIATGQDLGVLKAIAMQHNLVPMQIQ